MAEKYSLIYTLLIIYKHVTYHLKKMKYFTFHIDDSGAIEDIDYKKVNGQNITICKMYDDDEFNKLNDILHSINEFILNEKALNILKGSKTIQYDLRKAKVLRKEKLFGILKKNKSYDYFDLTFPDKYANECYNWIDFEKSEIFATDSNGEKFKIKSHQHKLDLISENKSDSKTNYSFETKKVFFGKNFDFEIDFFKIPLYSSGEYVSERFKNKMEKEKITDIRFAERKEQLNKIWQPMFPIIEFDNKNGR
ncbi:hypothetical protein [Mesonia sp. K7]|uniref:hypothetical protein n=1 Tax=Mesonia sp. K7 TaxID=2218606 RepID=UPI000DA9B9F1|nr:hypothetical protein [Mesonia sp. K7]